MTIADTASGREPLRDLTSGEEPRPSVVYLMGSARSGSTLTGTLIGQASDVFFAGELCDWPERDGDSSIPRSASFWKEVRASVDRLPACAQRFKPVMEHPAGVFRPWESRRLRSTYRGTTLAVLEAVSRVSGCTTIVDSSHYPRRAQELRRMLGPNQVRLLFVVRRPSAVARSFRDTGEKSELVIHTYLFVVGLLSWLVYLTHPREHRLILSYERLLDDPLPVGSVALGRHLEGVDPGQMAAPLVLIGNRFVRTSESVTIHRQPDHEVTWRDRITDLVQWPLRFACFVGEMRFATVSQRAADQRGCRL
jgi:hypothetical protein